MSAASLPLNLAWQSPSEPAIVPLWELVASSGLQAVVAGGSKDPNAKIAVLLVSPATGAPELVIKAPTTAGAQGAVDAEARVLRDLAQLDLGALARTLPTVAGTAEFEGRRALVTTALSGRPLAAAYAERRHTRSPERVEQDFRAGGAWLVELQRLTASGREPLEPDAGVTAGLRARFGVAAAAEVERVEAIHARLRTSETARTAVHGDFWCGNILVSGSVVSGVVDWEAASLRGEPVRDVVRFANMYALYLDRNTRPGRHVAGHPGLRADGWGAGLAYAIDGRGWFPELYRRFLAAELRRLGADPAAWRDAAMAGIAEVAALTDHVEFARLHLDLFRRLTSEDAA